MLNFENTAKKAAAEFGLSMKDDPTLWPEGGDQVTAEAVRKACNATALENARSALSRALSRIAETVATEMDVAIAEDGPLADLAAVLAQHVEDAPEIDLSAVAAAADWQARVEALREAFGVAVQGYHVPPLPVIDIMHYAGTDPRLGGEVMRTLAHLRDTDDKPDAPAALLVNQGGYDWDEDEPDAVDPWADEEAAPTARERGKPAPGRKRRTKAEIAEDEAADAIIPVDDEHYGEGANLPAAGSGWDDELDATVNPGGVVPTRERGKPWPGKARRTKAEIAEDEAAERSAAITEAVEAVREAGGDEWDESAAEYAVTSTWDEKPASEAPAPVLDAGWDDAAPVATAPTLPGLLSTAGIPDTDMAAILGLSKGYYSMIRNGKRPWPGVKPDQVQRLRVELHARREAIDAIDQALSTDAVLKPEGV